MSLDDAGVLTIHQDVAPVLDAEPVPWLSEAEDRAAQAIGAVHQEKSDIFKTTYPKLLNGPIVHANARAIALAAQHVPAQPWDKVLPAYHQASAPEIQRQQAAAKKAATNAQTSAS